jgi:hypothetical protein
MPRRLLPAALLIVVACAVALAIALRGETPATVDRTGTPGAGAFAAALSQTGTGPAGSAIVTLARWRYRADPRDTGRDLGWASGDWTGRPVQVPYSPNAMAYSGAAGQRAYDGSIGWYATDVQAPLAGLYAVRFESAHHSASVFVDGKPVREHVGAYEPFAARVPLQRGQHTIVVRVDWRGPQRQADADYTRSWFNYGGLNRPVTLMRLGRSQLGALTVRTRLRNAGIRARVDIGVRVRNRDVSRTIHVRGVLSRGGRTVSTLDFGPAGVHGASSRMLSTSVTVDRPALWSPTHPALYDLRIDVPGEATLHRRIGLREISWDGGTLQLNGAPLVLRGVALPPDARGHGDALTNADEDAIVAELRAAGANATRSQLPLSDGMLTRLDAAGILVWQELGPWEPSGQWQAHSAGQLASARDRALRTAEADQADPSILAWTLTNEAAGNGQPDEQEYVRQTAARLHQLDPSRPVAVDLWGSQLANDAGGMFPAVDAIGMTDYVGWYDGLDHDAAGQAAITSARIKRLHGLFPDKPIVVTELGAGGSARVKGNGFGSLRFQSDLLGRRLRELHDEPGLSGTIVWNLRDYALRPDFRGGSVLKDHPKLTLTPGLNEKGLYDFAGKPKPSLAVVHDAFAGG